MVIWIKAYYGILERGLFQEKFLNLVDQLSNGLLSDVLREFALYINKDNDTRNDNPNYTESKSALTLKVYKLKLQNILILLWKFLKYIFYWSNCSKNRNSKINLQTNFWKSGQFVNLFGSSYRTELQPHAWNCKKCYNHWTRDFVHKSEYGML